MKKIILLILLIGSNYSISFAQANYKNTDLLKAGTLTVVLSGRDTGFDNTLKTVLNEDWKFSKLKYIHSNQFDQNKTLDNEFYLLFYDVIGQGYIDHRISIKQGGKKGLDFMTTLCFFIFEEDHYSESLYAIPFVIKKFQSDLNYLSANHTINSDKYYDIQLKSISDLSERTLILKQKNISGNSTFEKIQSAYPYKLKLVNDNEYADAIMNGNKNTCFVYGDDLTLKIYDAGNYNILYYKGGYAGSHTKLDEKNIKLIADAVKK
ncbi:MAG: hypothetical protein WCI97_04280 [Bacteroidota bacterium]